MSIEKASWSNASLFIISDDNELDNLEYCTRLLNIFSKKLTDLKINLNKSFIINKNEFNSLVEQFIKTEKVYSQDFILVTTTSTKNDRFIHNLTAYLNGSKHELNKRIFFLEQCDFAYNLALCFRTLQKRQFIALGFSSESELKSFLSKNLNLNDANLSLDSVYLVKNNDLIIRNLFSNYFYCSIEIEFLNIDLLKTFRCDRYMETFPMADNYINADYYVYEFERLSKLLTATTTNTVPSYLDIIDASDVEFLESKIDYNSFLEKLKASIQIIEEAFKRYKSDQICVSFNGGKDCCVVLYLFYAVASRLGIHFPLNVLLIQIKHQFSEMNFFVENIHKHYYRHSFRFIVFSDVSKTMKDCLVEMKTSEPSINSILLGTRRSDGPYFKQMSAFAPTDGDWPEFMRINPILDWTFSEIWYFIRKLQLPYCSLYDQGYTSIDNTQNTIRNSGLLKEDGISYMPAYMLQNQDAERDSRRKVKN
jgi:3'-phosphoadenosine 5'-phosphosulfate sulfotransferase (PAPS reductase)/FAD synthetase